MLILQKLILNILWFSFKFAEHFIVCLIAQGLQMRSVTDLWVPVNSATYTLLSHQLSEVLWMWAINEDNSDKIDNER